MEGWIKLHRKLMGHAFYRERRCFSRLEAWLDLLFLANHKNHNFLLGGSMADVRRGEVITSELKLMERWRWSKAKVRRYLRCLVDEKMVIKKADNKKTSILIINWDTYQGKETAEKPQKNHGETTDDTADDTQSRMNKNEKNEEKKKSFLDSLSKVVKEPSLKNSAPEPFLNPPKTERHDQDNGQDVAVEEKDQGNNGQRMATKEEKEELARLCVQVSRRFENFNPHAWLARNVDLNPGALLHVMRTMATRENILSPWAYANDIARKENPNFNEADSITECEKHKKELGQVGQVFKGLLRE